MTDNYNLAIITKIMGVSLIDKRKRSQRLFGVHPQRDG